MIGNLDEPRLVSCKRNAGEQHEYSGEHSNGAKSLKPASTGRDLKRKSIAKKSVSISLAYAG